MSEPQGREPGTMKGRAEYMTALMEIGWTEGDAAERWDELQAEIAGRWQPADCPEMYGDNDQRKCVRCGAALTGKQQRWCSQECVNWYQQNHWFNVGRKVVAIAKTCALCGDSLVGRVEVDHIEPAKGRHAICSCIHHLSNLRAVHAVCHALRTADQRREGISNAQ